MLYPAELWERCWETSKSRLASPRFCVFDRLSQGFGNCGLAGGVPCRLNHPQIQLGPAFSQLKSPFEGADHVETAVDQNTGEVEAPRCAFEGAEAGVFEETVVGQIVGFKPSHAPGTFGASE